jgi:hypothetical protein
MEFVTALVKFFVNFWTDYVAAYLIDFFLGAL